MLNFKVGHFTWPSATGNYAVTGLGFKPKVVYLYGTNSTLGTPFVTNNTHVSKGAMTDQGQQFATCEAVEQGTGTGGGGALAQRIDRCYTAWKLSSDAGPLAEASYVSMDSDGFTINVIVTDAGGREVGYLAWGGDALRGASITEHGLQPNIAEAYRTFELGSVAHLLLTRSVGSPTSGNREGLESTTYSNDMALITRADGGVSNATNVVGLGCSPAQTTAFTGSSNCSGLVFFRFLDGSLPGLMFNATFRAFSGSILSVFRSIEADVPLYFHTLALAGLIGTYQALVVPATPQSVAYTLGFKPAGLLFYSNNTAVGGIARANSCQGFTDGVNHFACGTSTLRSAVLGVTRRRTGQYMSTSESVYVLVGPPGPASVIGTVTSLDPTGFTMNWTTVTSGIRVHAIAFKERPVAHASPETFLTGRIQ